LHIGEEVQVTFIPKKQVKEEMATPQEIRAIKNGRNAHARGEYISITDYIRGVETSPHKLSVCIFLVPHGSVPTL
jgi:hypothetical protein